MATTTLLTKYLIALCDGECGGEVELTTDGSRLAYAVVGNSRRYVSQDCDGIERHRDGSIVVQCAAYQPEAEERCSGSATFTPADLDEVAYSDQNGHASFMTPMEVED